MIYASVSYPVPHLHQTAVVLAGFCILSSPERWLAANDEVAEADHDLARIFADSRACLVH